LKQATKMAEVKQYIFNRMTALLSKFTREKHILINTFGIIQAQRVSIEINSLMKI
jgi:hypothetical protein